MLPVCRHKHTEKSHLSVKLNDIMSCARKQQYLHPLLIVQWNFMCTVVHYLSGLVYDMTESSGGRGSKPIIG